ncbi:MAG TPA: cytochrome C oxidase subunit IV family protein [Kofleriaceae bacterium]|nr:cytochrome C oxidase subunit IV family protein [Kofleriaceae bacterium]
MSTAERKDRPSHGFHYVIALVALLLLTGLSFGLSFLDLGALGTPLALSIAGVKVLIVGSIFMHLREAVFATRLVGLVTIIFIALLCLGIIADVAFRAPP